MRSSWPLLCILACTAAAACTKQSSKSDPAPVNESPTAAESPAPVNPESPADDSGAGLQEGTPSASTPTESPTGAPTQDPNVTPEGPAAGPTDTPVVAPTETPPETPVEPDTPTTPPDNTPPVKKSFSWSEEQYWTYTKDEASLKFNTPWDEEEGDAINKDYKSQPEFVQNCVESAKKNFEDRFNTEEFATSVDKIIQAGATNKLILFVNVVDQSKDRDALRRLDRDAYFWNWPDQKKRPYFALSNFKKGAFVWEIIAAKDKCIMPAKADVEKYLAYVEKRLTPMRGS